MITLCGPLQGLWNAYIYFVLWNAHIYFVLSLLSSGDRLQEFELQVQESELQVFDYINLAHITYVTFPWLMPALTV